MSSTTVEKIKEKLDIVEVVGSYLKLEKAGSNFKAKCPFHNEKTPSFFVSPGRGSFYCFGCGKGGDVFSFVEQFEGLDFMGALKVLAARAGIPLQKENPKAKNERERLFSCLEAATVFFEENLKGSGEAKEYVKVRGLSAKTIKEWRIGYARDEWQSLRTDLEGRGFTDEEMLRAGLIKKAENPASGEKFYDTFRGRVTFPIFDTSERVIAFSGRILKDDETAPKYLNSPETELFNKSETLYGLHKAKLPIRKKDYAILVEGQMDLLMAQQAGYENSVASSGTALTRLHLERLKRLSNRLILAFDSDSAGRRAAGRGALIALGLNMELKLAMLLSGSDPADLILSRPEEWQACLKGAKHLVDFHLDELLSLKVDERKLGREVQSKILPLVALLDSSVEKSHFISKIAQKTGIREEALWEDLKKAKPPTLEENGGDAKEKLTDSPEKSPVRKDFIERRLFGVLFWQENFSKPDLNPADLKKKIEKIVGEEAFEAMHTEALLKKDDFIFEAEKYYGNEHFLQNDINELLMNFEEDFLKQKFLRLMNDLNRAEREKDSARSANLLKECQEISKKIAELSKRKIAK